MSWVKNLIEGMKKEAGDPAGSTSAETTDTSVQKSHAADETARGRGRQTHPPVTVDVGVLAAEVARKMTAGELEAEQEVIKSFAAGRGLAEDDATQFAIEVLDAYFAVDDLPGDGGTQVTKSESTADMQSAAKIQRLQRSIQSLTAKMDAIGYAVSGLMRDGQSTRAETAVIKGLIEDYLKTPAGEKSPVTHSGSAGKGAGLTRSDTKQIIMKGITARQLGVEDMATFELSGRLTDRAEAYVRGNRQG